MNLVVNARDAMPGGGTLLIQTDGDSDSSGQYSRLSVRDTGHGIDAEIRSRIYDPFFTTKDAGKGTGLGLSMVYGIVQQSGGTINVESEPGKGSVFIIRLPTVSPPSPEKESSATASSVAQSHSRTILLVEDEAAVLQFTRTALSKAGFRVIATSSGAECLRAAELVLDSVDLLISDVVMPEMSGPEVVARLLERRPDLKVLYVSGYPDKILLPDSKTKNSLNFLQKPFKPDELISKVRELTGEHTATRLEFRRGSKTST
jgi:two-component system cell cycle sensor histidine kinase/response regulator CckA